MSGGTYFIYTLNECYAFLFPSGCLLISSIIQKLLNGLLQNLVKGLSGQNSLYFAGEARILFSLSLTVQDVCVTFHWLPMDFDEKGRYIYIYIYMTHFTPKLEGIRGGLVFDAPKTDTLSHIAVSTYYPVHPGVTFPSLTISQSQLKHVLIWPGRELWLDP